jgi:hypothetical protein
MRTKLAPSERCQRSRTSVTLRPLSLVNHSWPRTTPGCRCGRARRSYQIRPCLTGPAERGRRQGGRKRPGPGPHFKAVPPISVGVRVSVHVTEMWGWARLWLFTRILGERLNVSLRDLPVEHRRWPPMASRVQCHFLLGRLRRARARCKPGAFAAPVRRLCGA